MRRISNADFEGNHALISLAGFRVVKQNNLLAGAGADSTYTVQNANCRRVVVLHLATNDPDIRFEYNTVADATKIPILPRRYFIIDAGKGDVLHFWNTSGVAVTIYFTEIE